MVFKSREHFKLVLIEVLEEIRKEKLVTITDRDEISDILEDAFDRDY